jgi:hypothetical protein
MKWIVSLFKRRRRPPVDGPTPYDAATSVKIADINAVRSRQS